MDDLRSADGGANRSGIMRSADFECGVRGTSEPPDRKELEPVEVRHFEVRKYWPLRGWWRGQVGSLLGSYLGLHEKEQPQLRDCEVGPILSPQAGNRYGLWAVRSLAAERPKARALVLHDRTVTIYEGRETVTLRDIEQLNRLADLLAHTRDLDLPNTCGVRKVLVAFDCEIEARVEASQRRIEVVTSYRPPASTSLHVRKHTLPRHADKRPA